MMLARSQRFLSRLRGTQRIIFFLVLGYDLYIDSKLVQLGMGWFPVMVISVGVLSGSLTAWLLTHSQTTLERLMTLAGYFSMSIFLLSQGANVPFPFAVYILSHILLWFWFTTFFWFASRPYEFAFSTEENSND
ncbi:MAG: hypothetical protein Q8K78_14970 [Planctomycetaceae bacterium]|nr:hypothetical protein [Planctomycetaceae bacterium]